MNNLNNTISTEEVPQLNRTCPCKVYNIPSHVFISPLHRLSLKFIHTWSVDSFSSNFSGEFQYTMYILEGGRGERSKLFADKDVMRFSDKDI